VRAALDFGPFNHARLLRCWLGRAHLDLRLFQHAGLLRCRGGLQRSSSFGYPLAGVPAFAAIYYYPVGPVPPVAAHELRFAVYQLDRIPSTAPLRASKRLRPPSSFRQRSPACSEAIRLPHSGYEHLAVSEGIEAR
jgi:hypothetical protein